MRSWPKHPVIHEINTWVWLRELGQKYRRPLDLGTVPPEEWDRIASVGFDAVWFMGVWERSPAGIEISMRNAGLLEDFRRALHGPGCAGRPQLSALHRHVIPAWVVTPLRLTREWLCALRLNLWVTKCPSVSACSKPT